MNSSQYTIRSVPRNLDAKLRSQAEKTGKSLNQVLLESLAKGAGVNIDDASFSDLDWFVGSNKPDTSSDDALKWLDTLPKEIK